MKDYMTELKRAVSLPTPHFLAFIIVRGHLFSKTGNRMKDLDWKKEDELSFEQVDGGVSLRWPNEENTLKNLRVKLRAQKRGGVLEVWLWNLLGLWVVFKALGDGEISREERQSEKKRGQDWVLKKC